MGNIDVTNEMIQQYADAIRQANEAARAASKPEDGGTANLDSVTINFTGWPKRFVTQIQNASGVRLDKITGTKYWRGSYWVDIETSGQGNNRARMVDTACKKLVELGIPAAVYYQMD